MIKRKGDAAVTIIIVVVVILIILVSYFMFFRNTDDDNTGNMDNVGTNNETNNQVGIYDNNNDFMNNDDFDNNTDNTNNDMTGNRSSNINNNDVTIANENANNFYQRVKRGITLNGNLVEVPAEYMTRLINKIGEVGYELTDSASNIVNSKYDEIEQTLQDNNVSDINDLDAATKDKVGSLIQDIENAL